MARYHFRLPDVGEGVAEAEVVVWHVKVGDAIKEDQSLVDVMTDKATVDMTSPVDGVVTAVHGEIGDMVPVGSVLVELDVAGAGNVTVEAEAVIAAPPASPEPAPRATDPLPPPAPARPSPVFQPAKPRPVGAAFASRAPGDAPHASPATRRRAYDLGIPLQFVHGTGPGGRITADDLDSFIASGGTGGGSGEDARYAQRQGVGETKIIGLRRRIAEKMQDAKRRIPHIAYVEEMDVSQIEALRQDLNAHRSSDQPKLTLLPFFVRALVNALREFPQINARYDDEAGMLHTFDGVHVGIATQTAGGLMVPVVRHAEGRDVWSLAAEIARVSTAARGGSAARDELSGSTVTITSLGTLGGVVTTPVINHPEVAIIGPNKIVERPVVEGSFITVRKMMNVSSSFDHRIIDGYDAAQFVQRMKRLIEHPALIFMD
jgi:2-oxoisovalerate dehydrogenase E2 component (dihydrolipoyl transacylase)